MTEAAISPGFVRDLYVSLVNARRWGLDVRLYHKPFVDWIWSGCLIMALGGILAISDRRYDCVRRKEAECRRRHRWLARLSHEPVSYPARDLRDRGRFSCCRADTQPA